MRPISQRVWMSVLILGVLAVLAACTGSSQQEYGAVKTQLAEKEAALAQLQQASQTTQNRLAEKEAALAKAQGEAAAGKARVDALTVPFKEWGKNWVQKAKTGSLRSDFEVKVLKTYDGNGPRRVNPKPGDTLVYVTSGNQNWAIPTRPNETNTNKYTRTNVISARTKELLASVEMTDGPGRSHTSVVTADGRYTYLPGGEGKDSVVWKVDALTLQPVKKLDLGGNIHHMQVFQDRYILVDTFGMSVPGGRATFLLDPATDEVVGGIRSEGMGGSQYTAWPDPKQEHIYLLMEPDDVPGTNAVFATGRIDPGKYWVAKVDPKDWSVVREYPYPGYRSDWVQFSADSRFMYVDGSLDDSVMKINLETGELVWKTDVGVGPYAIELTADGKEVWVTDKGESWKAHKGRTITVVDAEKGNWLDTIVYGGRGVDHLTLSPDGKEVWATANDSGTVYVISVATRQTIAEVPLPQFGDPHGVVFVHYDQDGKARVVADQGDFKGGVDPRNGRSIR